MRPRLIALTLTALLTVLISAALGSARGEEDEHRGRHRPARPDVAPVDNELYAKECGACHFAYPPGLLPARSWEKLLTALSQHFGDNAELSPEDAKAIAAYLTASAADRSQAPLSARIARSVAAGETPTHISEISYIAHEHREIPGRMFKNNPQVKSLAHCDACHTRAAAGSFDEHEVQIPGYGRWEE